MTLDYYTFGGLQKGYNNVVSSNGNGLAQAFKFSDKELSQELGLNTYDFGARNYDPWKGRWDNIDPLAEKFYDKSPYHMASNNPILFMDFNGEDYVITIDFDKETVEVSGTLYAASEDVGSAQKAADAWNSESGGFSYSFDNGDGEKTSLAVDFNINVQEVKVGEGQSKIGALNKALVGDDSGGGNVFNVVADGALGENTNGKTQSNYIQVEESNRDGQTAIHEVGHALGVPHSEKGIMTAASSDPNRTSNINRTNVQNQVRNPIRGKTFVDGRGKATMHVTGTGVKPPDTNKAQRKYKNGKVKDNE